MKLPILSEMIAESMWRAMGWTCDSRQNAVLTTLKHVCAWWSTTGWQNAKAKNITVDTSNHTRWNHKIEVACGTRLLRTAAYDKKEVPDGRVSMSSVEHSVIHRPKIGANAKRNKERKASRSYFQTR